MASQGQPTNWQLPAAVVALGSDTGHPSTPAGAGLGLPGQTDEQGKEDRSYASVTLRVPAESLEDMVTSADVCPTKQQFGGECDG